MIFEPATLLAGSARAPSGTVGAVAGAFILGIDPGQSGGFGLVGIARDEAHAYKMPETDRDVWDLIDAFRALVRFAFLERVHAMPRQGVSSSFKFGDNFGYLRGCITAAGIPWEYVTPQSWQKGMSCLSKGQKNVTKARAQQLFPTLKITHAVADALLIAAHGKRLYAARTPKEG